MQITIHRGAKEIGGTLIELKSNNSKLLIDAGFPLLLNGEPIDTNATKWPVEKLIETGVLPDIKGLYSWDKPSFDAVIISHAHIDHYGLLKYIHPDIPVYLSEGTKKLIEISQLFKICEAYPINSRKFSMYESFNIGEFHLKPYLMDHSAFDSAAFEITSEGITVIYSGDFRGHGRKSVCLDSFIQNAKKQADLLLTEGTMFGRAYEEVLTENELEERIIKEAKRSNSIALFQSSSQNIDRIVTFYRAAVKLGKIFVIDVYTANVLYELRMLGNNLPFPSFGYSNIKVFYPYRLTQKIFNDIGEDYAKRFSAFHISKEKLTEQQSNIIMMIRPSMLKDIKKCWIHDGVFIYSMWQGYRDSDYQKRFEDYLISNGFTIKMLHTSGHASITDIRKLISGLNPKKIVPIHTMVPEAFMDISDITQMAEDGIMFSI